MELVKCNNLCKKFDDKQVLNNINLSIPKGKNYRFTWEKWNGENNFNKID